ncbi:hypothetical protein GCM10010228_79750 [Streptomyces massasporeus]|nr:hypothetical protein GCM10010228_79750 [Streptomyces massasporeus]
MNVHPFIEAEKQAGHSVKRACELLKVSRAAFYARRAGTPGPRAVQDAELTEQITTVHAQSRGTYGAPRIHAVLKREGAACGRRRIARLMRAAGLAGRHRKRRHRTTIPDPHAVTRPDLVLRDFRPDPTRPRSTPAGAATSPTSPPTRAGSTWPPSSTSHPDGWSAGPPPTTCVLSWSPTHCEPPATSAAPQVP